VAKVACPCCSNCEDSDWEIGESSCSAFLGEDLVNVLIGLFRVFFTCCCLTSPSKTLSYRISSITRAFGTAYCSALIIRHFLIQFDILCFSSIFLLERPTHGETLNLVYVSWRCFGVQNLQHMQIHVSIILEDISWFVTRVWDGRSGKVGLIPGIGKRFLYNDLTGYGALAVSCWVGTWGSS
jgi:hypothetical protein